MTMKLLLQNLHCLFWNINTRLHCLLLIVFLLPDFIYQIPLKHEIEENILEIMKKEVNYKIINSAFIVYDFLKEKQEREDSSEVNNIIDSLNISRNRGY